MVVKVSFYSYFKELTGCASITQSLPAQSTLTSLLDHIIRGFPKMAGMEKSLLMAVGLDYQGRDYVLHDGDEVSLFPPVQGG